MAEASIPSATCGIYGIFGPRGRVYVGQSVCIRTRWKAHLKELDAGRHTSFRLQAAWDKYGPLAFTFEILAGLPRDKYLLTLCEQEFMDFYRGSVGVYNTAPAAASALGVRWTEEQRERHRLQSLSSGVHANFGDYEVTEEHREKLRAARKGRRPALGMKMSPEHKAAIVRANTGRQKSADERARISAANSGKVISQETRAKLSAAHSGKVISAEHRYAIKQALSDRKRAGLSVGRPVGTTIGDAERAKRRLAMLGKSHSEGTRFQMRRTRYAMQNPGLTAEQLDALASLPSYREFGSRAEWERARIAIIGS